MRGLYAGNPQRATARPTTEKLLQAFRGITLTVVEGLEETIRHITPLTDLQRRILAWMGLPVSLYDALAEPVHAISPYG